MVTIRAMFSDANSLAAGGSAAVSGPLGRHRFLAFHRVIVKRGRINASYMSVTGSKRPPAAFKDIISYDTKRKRASRLVVFADLQLALDGQLLAFAAGEDGGKFFPPRVPAPRASSLVIFCCRRGGLYGVGEARTAKRGPLGPFQRPGGMGVEHTPRWKRWKVVGTLCIGWRWKSVGRALEERWKMALEGVSMAAMLQ